MLCTAYSFRCTLDPVSSSVGVEKCVLKILSVAKIEKIADRKCQEAEQFLLSGKKSDALNCYIEALYIDKNHAKAHAGMKNLYSGEYFVNSKENSYAGWRLGSVEWFNYKKGFGFVSDEDGTSHFIHISSVERYGESIADGDFIVFQIQSSHGKTAVATFVNLSNR